MKQAKWKSCLKSIGLLVAVMVSVNSQAAKLYGLENTRHLSSNLQAPFYIQAGAFKIPRNAINYAQELSNRYPYPVRIVKKALFNRVIIGPLPNVAAVEGLTAPQTLFVSNEKKENQPVTLKGKGEVHQTASSLVEVPDFASEAFETESEMIIADAEANNLMMASDDLIATAGQRDLLSQAIGDCIIQYAVAELKNYAFLWDVSKEMLPVVSNINLLPNLPSVALLDWQALEQQMT
ncbi:MULTISPECIES: SPOR domain-containing protein [unclassified Legionella]|uniref:SPOR domain-containing protein n=1 Tax=unclassified Legionella TaxID=2622702 RepID=UPI001054C6CB|nr:MULTISPECIES: SPOR domain-containing protein [unclassified Legionella]MDI9819661.1 SPOR domain-containing protein [Legionella sp. PL877]